MIDVGAMDLHNLENEEYNDRIKLYSQRLQQQWNSIQHPEKEVSGTYCMDRTYLINLILSDVKPLFERTPFC